MRPSWIPTALSQRLQSRRDGLRMLAGNGGALTRKDSPMATRTTHRSSSGKKLYAVRDASGKFKDIQTYERAHRADLRKTSQTEMKAAAKKR
jgi:hypothetical protein